MNNIIKITFLLFSFSGFAQQFEGESQPLFNLNSPYGEEFISISPNGRTLLFSRINHPYNQGGRTDSGDIWESKYDSVWRAPDNFHATNDDVYSSPIGFSNDGSTILYNRLSAKGGTRVSEIWALSDNQKEQLNIKYFANKSPHQSACLSADNRFMIISMQSGATIGVEDLYLIKREGNNWSAPKNLGTTVNSKFQEITPFLSADTKRLYFSTNGRKGLGSFDVYVTNRLDDTWRNWSEPRNLGNQINSSGRETSFILNRSETEAFFVSTQNSDGYGDIQSIGIRNDSLEVFVDVDTTGFLEEIDIPDITGLRLLNAKDSKPLRVGLELLMGIKIVSGNTNELGVIELVEGLAGEIEVKGFLGSPFETFADSLVEVRLEPLEVGRTIRLEHVFFYRGKAEIMESSFPELNEVVEMLKRNPEINILLKGHTDGNGDPDQNLKLSEERVQAARKYLIKQGVSKKRIAGVGLGGTEPIASNNNEESRKLNRRVEFEIIE